MTVPTLHSSPQPEIGAMLIERLVGDALPPSGNLEPSVRLKGNSPRKTSRIANPCPTEKAVNKKWSRYPLAGFYASWLENRFRQLTAKKMASKLFDRGACLREPSVSQLANKKRESKKLPPSGFSPIENAEQSALPEVVGLILSR